MPVESTHSDYNANVSQWRKCRDVMLGEEAVKVGGTAYLPMLAGQDTDEYNNYKFRAVFYEATGRTVSGLSGEVMRKGPQIEAEDTIKEGLFQHLGEAGESLELIAQQTLDEVIAISRVGLMVDAPEQENAEPYVTQYYAESIINWRERLIVTDKSAMLQPVLVVLMETKDVIDEDGFGTVKEERIRVLKLVDDTEAENGRYYVQELWRPTKEKDKDGLDVIKWVLEKSIIPTMIGGKRFDFLPFQFVNPSGLGAEVEPSPIRGLVNLNLAHYRNSADLEHGRHFTGLPQLYLAGFDPKTTKIKIGSSQAWTSENPQAKAEYVEFKGQGLQALEKGMEEKEAKMAVLGARLLEKEPNQQETATAVKLRRSGERSILATIASTVSEALTNVIRWVGLWSQTPGSEKWSIKLSQDYDVAQLDAQTLLALMQAVQGGTYSYPAYYSYLDRAEMFPDGWTEEQERDAIEAGSPLPPAGDIVSQKDEISLEQQKQQLDNPPDPTQQD